MSKDEKIKKFEIVQKRAEEIGTNVSKVAVECGMSENIMTYWKKGRSMPKADKLLKIAQYLEIPVEELIA